MMHRRGSAYRFSRGEAGAAVRRRLKRNAGRNVLMLSLWGIFPALSISPFLFRPGCAGPPSPRGKGCSALKRIVSDPNLTFPRLPEKSRKCGCIARPFSV